MRDLRASHPRCALRVSNILSSPARTVCQRASSRCGWGSDHDGLKPSAPLDQQRNRRRHGGQQLSQFVAIAKISVGHDDRGDHQPADRQDPLRIAARSQSTARCRVRLCPRATRSRTATARHQVPRALEVSSPRARSTTIVAGELAAQIATPSRLSSATSCPARASRRSPISSPARVGGRTGRDVSQVDARTLTVFAFSRRSPTAALVAAPGSPDCS